MGKNSFEHSVIGVWPLCSTAAVLVHKVDGEKVLASINGIEPEWCNIKEEYWECTGELEPGFLLGSLFVPFCEVMMVEREVADENGGIESAAGLGS